MELETILKQDARTKENAATLYIKQLQTSSSTSKINTKNNKNPIDTLLTSVKSASKINSLEESSTIPRTKTISSLFDIKRNTSKGLYRIYAQCPKTKPSSNNKAPCHSIK